VLSLAAWAQDASARLGRGLGVGVWRRVVSVFGQFPLLTGHSLLLNEKAELLLVALKKMHKMSMATCCGIHGP
jgi:hypothetical protein